MSVVVTLPDEIAARAAVLASERGVTMDEVVSELVREHLPAPHARRARPGFVGLGRSTSGRSASEADDMLAEGFGRD